MNIAAVARMATACLYVAVPFTTASPTSSIESIGGAIFGKLSPLGLTDNRMASPLAGTLLQFFVPLISTCIHTIKYVCNS